MARKRRYQDVAAMGRNASEAIVAGEPFPFSKDLDKRTAGYKCFASLQDAVISDLGGAARSTLEARLIQHACALSAFVESEEARLLQGEDMRYPDLYVSGINALGRLARVIGLRRIPREPQTLEAFLAARRQDAEAESRED